MKHLRKLADDRRSGRLNTLLGFVCAFVAGGINASGFIIVGEYTSHLTGVVARTADMIALSQWSFARWGAACTLMFILGAMLSAMMIYTAKRLKLHSRFAIALLVSGSILVGLGLWASMSHFHLEKTLLILGLFFSMGIQNATVSELTNSEIRATHMTGVITDIGIEVGHWVTNPTQVMSQKLRILLLFLGAFFLGGIIGTVLSISSLGPLALCGFGGILILLSLFPVYRDTHIRFRYYKSHRHK